MSKGNSRITPILLSALVAIITGVIANRVDALFFSSNPQPKALFLANLIPWCIAGLFLLCIFVLLYLRWSDRKMWEKLFLFNEILLRYPPNLIGMDDLDERFRRLIDILLTFALQKLFPGSRRGVLMTPDSSRNNYYLIIYHSSGIQHEYEKGDEFYIGNDENQMDKRGIAGKAFKELKQFLVHIDVTTDNKLVKDDDDYIVIKYKGSEDGDIPPHKSLICFPILDGSPTAKAPKEPLGVVCFDSQHRNTFDSYESNKRLELLTKHICAAFRTHSFLRQKLSSGSQS